jgi:hypothetical protein
MKTMPNSGAGPDPIEGIIAILGDGAVNGTNKYLLLLALIDRVTEVAYSRNGHQELTITVSELAESLIRLQWEHGRPFSAAGPLRQMSTPNREMSVLSAVHELFESTGADDRSPPSSVKTSHEQAWQHAIQKVGFNLSRNPVSRLQRIAGKDYAFLYDYEPGPEGRQWDGTLTLFDQAVNSLIRFGPVLRPMIEFQASELVARINLGVNGPTIADHLFGGERRMPPPSFRKRLVELQSGRCLWSGQKLTSEAHADHIVPWARARLSIAENFAMTTPEVNVTKTQMLIGPRMIQRWVAHLTDNRADIAEAAVEANYEADIDRVLSVSKALIARAPLGTPVFEGESETLSLTDEIRSDCLRTLRTAD